MMCGHVFLKKILLGVTAFFLITSIAFADVTSDLQKQAQRKRQGAEIFGVMINNVSKSVLEKKLSKMGLRPYPSYKKNKVTYSLGPDGILGIKELQLTFNDYDFIRNVVMSGVVKSPKNRQKLGLLLVKKYGNPNLGFVKDGYGRAKWFFKDGTYIELRNTTFNVSVKYVDQTPKILKESGTIDVEALSRGQ